MLKIDRWFTATLDPYSPPEHRLIVLGIREDGKSIRTSVVVSCEGSVITTFSGSTYELLEPCPEWISWLAEHGHRMPTKEEAIKIHETEKNTGRPIDKGNSCGMLRE